MEQNTSRKDTRKIAVGTFMCSDEIDLIVPQMERMLTLCDKVIVLADCPDQHIRNILNSFVSDKVEVLVTTKIDKQKERDEWGDRSRLYERARELGARLVYHTDVDELIDLRDMQKVSNLIRMNDGNRCYAFPRYDMWGDAYHYRIPYNNDKHAGSLLKDVMPPGQSTYIIPVKKEMFYQKKSIPNFHCPREPMGCPKAELITDIRVIHYGYYTEEKRKFKEKFYKQPAAGECWGHDMNVSLKEFMELWGIGSLSR